MSAEVFFTVLSCILASILAAMFMPKVIVRLCFGPRSAAISKQQRDIGRSSVSFLSVCAEWRPGWFAMGGEANKGLNFESVLGLTQGVDVVCVSAAHSFRGSPVARFVRAAQDRGFVVYRTSPGRIASATWHDAGCLLLSRLPVLACESIHFDLVDGPDMLYDRGVLYCRVQTGPGTHLHVAVTELNRGDSRQNEAVRWAQGRAVRAFLSRRAADGQPVLLMGRFHFDALGVHVKAGKRWNQYEKMESSLALDGYELHDVVKEQFGESVATAGGKAVDFVLRWNRDEAEYSIIDSKVQVEGEKDKGLRVEVTMARREGSVDGGVV